MSISREQALQYVCYGLDDALNPNIVIDEKNAVLVGWQCGFEPMFIAVQSYLPNTILSRESAIDIAIDYLKEIEWFADAGDDEADNSAIEPDYVIGGIDD